MTKPIIYITLILFAFNVFFAIGEYEQRFRPVTLTHAALAPVHLLVNSKLYLEEKDSARSRNQLNAALVKIKKLRADLKDAQSIQLINSILPELEFIKTQSQKHPVDIHVINEEYVKMLLALSYLQVRHALVSSESQNEVEMHLSLKRAMYIVKKALMLSEGSKIEHEVMIYADMNDIVRSRIREEHEIKQTLQHVLTEIEGLEIAFHE